jgi:hypothetical protein
MQQLQLPDVAYTLLPDGSYYLIFTLQVPGVHNYVICTYLQQKLTLVG